MHIKLNANIIKGYPDLLANIVFGIEDWHIIYNMLLLCTQIMSSSLVKPAFPFGTGTCPTLPSRRVPLLSFSVSGRPGIRTVEILTPLQVLWRRLERSTVKACLRVQMTKKQTLRFEGLLKTTCTPPDAIPQHLQFRVQVKLAKAYPVWQKTQIRCDQSDGFTYLYMCKGIMNWNEFGTDSTASKCFSQSAKPSQLS